MAGKCFCHLGGLAVKDAEARRKLSVIESEVAKGNLVKPTGDLPINKNGTHNVASYKTVTVNVEGSGGIVPKGTLVIDDLALNGKIIPCSEFAFVKLAIPTFEDDWEA